MRLRFAHCLLLVLSLGAMGNGLPLAAVAQSAFSNCATRTATNASLILPADLEVILNGTQENGPWEVAVFSPEGHCAGTTRWANETTTLAAWGTPGDTTLSPAPSATALAPGDSMHVRLFNTETGTQYTGTTGRISVSFRSDKAYLRASPVFVPDGIYVLDQIVIQTSLVRRED